LRFLTLGGEIADQRILDGLQRRYPNDKVTHIYATSETGAVFSVSDGLAGFPVSYVGKTFRSGKAISIIDGEIVVHLPHSKDRLVHTGDYVVLEEGRYVFDGRHGTHINVGGTKVSLTEVERVAIQFDGVFDCQASGIPNPFSGQSVLLKVIWTDEFKIDELLSHLRAALPRAAVPALIETVSKFTINENQKKVSGGHS
jgi:acyl-CoA synthetase (AMP-forming)/AMP-acid ligase II